MRRVPGSQHIYRRGLEAQGHRAVSQCAESALTQHRALLLPFPSRQRRELRLELLHALGELGILELEL